MPKIFKPPGKSKYVVFYTDHNRRRRKKTLATDRETSERIARDLLNKNALRKEGLIDERDERFAEHEARPIKDHLADYDKFVTDERATPKYVRQMVQKVETIVDLADPKIRRISGLTLERVKGALAKVREIRSVGTVNLYIQHIKSFSRWLWRTKRAKEYALVDLQTKTPNRGERRRVRRRMTDSKVVAVISAAEQGDHVLGVSGPDRAVLYRLAHGTGFRSKELRTLTPERFRLDDDPPTVTVLACYAKNGEETAQPIAKSLADRLRAWLAGKRPGVPVFDGITQRTAEMLRVDLGASDVPYETDDGVADFHASRGTYISNLVASGASVKTCQELARHSTPTLTIGIYAKASVRDKYGAVENLPDLAPSQPTTEAMSATGTNNCRPAGQSATLRATSDAERVHGDSRNILAINGLSGDADVRNRIVVQGCSLLPGLPTGLL